MLEILGCIFLYLVTGTIIIALFERWRWFVFFDTSIIFIAVLLWPVIPLIIFFTFLYKIVKGDK
jgi:hypothetical protein